MQGAGYKQKMEIIDHESCIVNRELGAKNEIFILSRVFPRFDC